MAKQKVDEEIIIKESLKLFRQTSYHTTSMADISKACGIQKGSLYHYFSSKEELMMKVIAFVHDFFKNEIFALAYNEDIEPVVRLDKMFSRANSIFINKETGEMLGNIGVETALVIPEFQPVIQVFFKDFFNAVKKVYSSKYSENVANELAERAVAEIEGSLLLARIFNDNSFLNNTHKRLVARLQ
jgi:TetR/AcrR family transcriptional repressor of nem operon